MVLPPRARQTRNGWKWLWGLLEEKEVQPGVNLKVTKIKAHVKRATVRNMSEDMQELHALDDTVDGLAKQGAKESGVEDWQVLHVMQVNAKAKRVLEYVGSFRVLIQGVEVTAVDRAAGVARRPLTRPAPSRGHSLRGSGSAWQCTACGARCSTLGGLRRLRRGECRPEDKLAMAARQRTQRNLRAGRGHGPGAQQFSQFSPLEAAGSAGDERASSGAMVGASASSPSLRQHVWASAAAFRRAECVGPTSQAPPGGR